MPYTENNAIDTADETKLTATAAEAKHPKENVSPSTSPVESVHVFVRVRPLIQEEAKQGHKSMAYTESSDKKSLNIKLSSKKKGAANAQNINPAFKLPPRLLTSQQREQWKTFSGFTSVLTPESSNEQVYKTAVQPLLTMPQKQEKQLSDNKDDNDTRGVPPPSCCVFTYGHTGSGKTHTLLGYDRYDDKSGNLGIYKYAARDIFAMLDQYNKAIKQDDQQRVLLLRATELYMDKARDLFTGDECSVREDKHGVAHVRGPFVEDEKGRLDPKPLGRLCFTAEQVMENVGQACISRRTGTSTHHDQSSRSRLVLELEIGVTPALIHQRKKLALHETMLTRLQWLQTERSLGNHLHHKHPEWTEEYAKSPSKLRQDISKYELLVHESRDELLAMEQTLWSSDTLCGKTLVFCDLAGNEYAKDAALSTQQQMDEAAQINKSLLAVKEMIRGIIKTSGSRGNRHHHVSYRDSKLSMILARHLGVLGNSTRKDRKDNNTSGCRAVMLGHISPSEEFVRKTVNTLVYCSMIAEVKGNSSKK